MTAVKQPNIIYILADDLGYGDLPCNNPRSRIPTPNLDRLAARGMRFSDAHAASAVCTPSRYALLTGRYPWRSRLKRGIVWEWDGPMIEPDRLTVAELLRGQGYCTACIGKWHLGWDWPTRDGRHPNETLEFGVRHAAQRLAYEANIDYTGRIRGGPTDRGFDSYFGVDVPNFPPYTWFKDDRLVEPPSIPKPAELYGNPGLMVPGWKLEAMIPEFTRRAVGFIEQQAKEPKPFFLYFPLTSPHSPVVPNAQFIGRSGIGRYGDFVMEVDWVVGQVMEAIERAGVASDTLLVFASDNGPEGRTPDDEGVYERAQRTEHLSMGELRGMKRDAWEGGHRVPLLMSWPRVIAPGTSCDQTVCLSDFMATCASITEAMLPADAGEDSVSMWPLLTGRADQPTRRHMVYHSLSGKFALRQGPWVFIDAPSGGDNPEPQWFQQKRGYTPHAEAGELFELVGDLSQRVNRYAQKPEMVQQMRATLDRVRAGKATPEGNEADEAMTE